MAIEIRPVANAEELRAVQQQRYAIYIEELGYANPHVDPGTRVSGLSCMTTVSSGCQPARLSRLCAVLVPQ